MKNMGKVMVLSTGLLLGGLSSGGAIPLAPISIDHAEAASSVRMSKTSYQTTANLRMRTGASTKYKTILTIPKGKVVYATEKNGSYYKVSYTYKSKGKTITKTGWVSGSYVKEYNLFTKTSGTYYFTKKTVKLYPSPDTKKKAVASLSIGNGLYSTQKVVNSIGKTWYRVTYNGKYMYIYSGDVSKSSAKTFAKKNYQINKDTYVYSSYGPAYAKLIKIPKGTVVSSVKSIGDWYAVTYKGKTGYAAKSYLQSTAEKPQEITPSGINYLVTGDVNFRQNGEGSSVMAVIPEGTTVVSTGKKTDDWYQVHYKGKIGYVFKSYLKEYKKSNDYRFIDLRTKSNVTATKINQYIAANVKNKPSVLLNKGQAFIDAGNKYGINALYLAAHAIHESGFGTSNISLGKKNLFGYGAYDSTPFVGAYRFGTVEECINYVAQKMKSDYLNPDGSHFVGAFLGYRTNNSKGTRVDSQSIGMNYWYASDPYWGSAIAGHMKKILAFDQKYYDKASINTNVPVSPGIPVGKDKFPAGIQAKSKRDLSSTIKKGTTFLLLEKSNDYNLKVNVNKKDSTIKISFSKYKDYFSVLNLGRVSGSSYLNVRPDPSTKNKEIAQLHLNDYVHLVLDAKGNLLMDKTKEWYNIKLSNGNPGWVHEDYIVRELK